MTIKQFIERAIEGGWNPKGILTHPDHRFWWWHKDLDGHEGLSWAFNHPIENSTSGMSIEEILIDPEAWKAVGKVEGWKSPHNIAIQTEWSKKMHGLVDALIFGKTIEQYLETL